MWEIRVESYGCIVPLGNSGAQKLHNKTRRGWLFETETLRKMGGTVYIINNYTAEMCTMSSKQLASANAFSPFPESTYIVKNLSSNFTISSCNFHQSMVSYLCGMACLTTSRHALLAVTGRGRVRNLWHDG